MKQGNTLRKGERISGKYEVDLLFEKGTSLLAFPLRVVFLKIPCNEGDESVSILASVPKRRFKSAVKRNRLKRLIREAYRLNNNDLCNSVEPLDQRLLVAFMYVSDSLGSYEIVEKGMKKALTALQNQLQ